MCVIVLHDAIEKGMPLSLANTLARLTEVRDALMLKESFETSLAGDYISPEKTWHHGNKIQFENVLEYFCSNVIFNMTP